MAILKIILSFLNLINWTKARSLIWCQIICDFVHISPTIINILDCIHHIKRYGPCSTRELFASDGATHTGAYYIWVTNTCVIIWNNVFFTWSYFQKIIKLKFPNSLNSGLLKDSKKSNKDQSLEEVA